MKREKIKTLCAEVNTDNEHSLRFHKRIGFKIIKENHEHEPGYNVNFILK